jgi:hypothetical protein
MNTTRPRTGLAGEYPRALAFPAHMSLYCDTDQLKWNGNALLIRQRDICTRSPLVATLFEQLMLVVGFALEMAGAPRHERDIEIEDMTFTLDASAPVEDNTRRYVFELKIPVSGKVSLHEVNEFGRRSWRYFIEVQGQKLQLREVSQGVAEYAGKDAKRLSDEPRKDFKIQHGSFTRVLEI